MADIIQSFSVLHDNNIIHGDPTGFNMMIGDDLRVHFIDFGESKIYRVEDEDFDAATNDDYDAFADRFNKKDWEMYFQLEGEHQDGFIDLLKTTTRSTLQSELIMNIRQIS